MIPFDPNLELLCSTLTAEDAHELRQERAGIFEFEASMDRVTAEEMAGLGPPSPSRTPLPRIESTVEKPG